MSNVLIIDDNKIFAQFLAKLMETEISPFDPSGMHLGEIIDHLQSFQSQSIESIFISAETTFVEYPSKSDSGGIELAKHIRVTPELGRLCLLPVIIGVWLKPEEYMRNQSDNILLSSPGIQSLLLPFTIEKISSALKTIPCFESVDALRRAITDYIPLTGKDKATLQHDYRNRVGATKLIKELLGNDAANSTVMKEYEHFRKDALWLKKMEFQQNGNNGIKQVGTQLLKIYRSDHADIRILLIDDEHRNGWSYALCKAFVGDVPEDQFQSSEHRILIANGRFQCVDSFETASEYFSQDRKNIENLLSQWSDAHSRLLHFKEQEYRLNVELPTRIKGIEARNNAKKQEIEETNRQIQGLSQQVHDLERACEQAWLRLPPSESPAARLLNNQELISILKDLVDIKTKHKSFEQEWEQKSAKEYEWKKELEVAEKELAKLNEEKNYLQRNTQKAEEEERQLRNNITTFSSFDLIFLDLRLDPAKDQYRNITEISGIKLLQQIKAYDPSIPVIILTASEKALSLLQAYEYGAEGYWIKGIENSLRLVEKIIELSKNIDIRKRIWMKIKQVEKMKVVSRCIVHLNESLENVILRDEETLLNIKTLLRESFAFSVGNDHGVKETIIRMDSYELINLRIGQLQEFRVCFSDKENDNAKAKEKTIWGSLTRKKLLSNKEESIKGFRNPAAHFQSKKTFSAADKLKIIDNFEYTLDSLLET